jgi:nucleotide-binding universal stress UspA family protein
MRNLIYELQSDFGSAARVIEMEESSEAHPRIVVEPDKSESEPKPAAAAQKVLVPVALSSRPPSGLAIARNLARERGAGLVLLHAIPLNIVGEERGIHRARLLEELHRDADLRLREIAGKLANPAGTETMVRAGKPADVILKSARELRASTIFLSTRPRSGWLRWLHRNTALKVMENAPCPVWLLATGKPGNPSALMILDRRTAHPDFARAVRKAAMN